jgi:cytochrome c biogenesis protein CcmG, thiol:disulfide interchange protein DsbE
MSARWVTHRYVLRAAVGGLAIALLVAGLLAHASTARRRAPALPRQTLSGTPTTLAELRGRPAVVLFWAPWCTPCQHEATAVERFARSSAGRGRIVAVDDDYGGGWRGFVRRYGWTLPVLADANLTVGDAYAIPGLPTTVFLDRNGRIAAMSSGAQTLASLTRGLSAAGEAA